MGNTLKKISQWVYYIVILLVVLLMLNTIISRSEKIFNVVGFRMYTVLTGSMEPEIMPGDLAVVKAIEKDKLEVNDIITFKYDGHVVTHRIVQKQSQGFTTKGDNNNIEDRELIKDKDIIGKVITVIPKLGYVMKFISKPFILVALMVILALLILKDTFIDSEDNNEGAKGKV